MKLRTRVLDGLYLNWALPAEAVPEPPPSLRYERHAWAGGEWVFATALLFRQQGLRLAWLPMLRLSYAQLNLRLYVEDREGVPSVFFRHMLVPPWVVPVARLVGRQPASPGRFRYPRPSRSPDAGEWRWRVSGGSSAVGLEVRVRQGSPAVGAGPPLGSWDKTVHYFRDRMRGYAEVDGRLHKIDTEQPRVAVWPVAAEVVDGSLLEASLPLAGGAAWPPLHSAWLCPEIPFTYELSVAPQLEISPRLPQAAASSRSRV